MGMESVPGMSENFYTFLLNFVATKASRHVFMFHSLPGTSNAGFSEDEIQPLQMALDPFLKTYLLLGPHQDP
jgi:hypothetical protein